MDRPFKKILIVGAGPAGLLLALQLSNDGIPVHVVEMDPAIDRTPRGAYYGTGAIEDLQNVGVLDEIRQLGFTPQLFGWYWYHKDGKDFDHISTFSTDVLADVDGVDLRTAALPQQDLCKVLLKHAQRNPSATITFGVKVLTVGQDEDQAWAEVETNGEVTKMYADYIIGCDGGRSTVRKSLFGREFPGHTWETQVVSNDLYYNITDKFGWADANFVVHPTNFFVAAKLTSDGLYRITYGEPADLSYEEAQARVGARLEEILPGHPKPGSYKILRTGVNKIYQRCASSLRVGRILLASDAGHMSNPMGGWGVTTGFADVGGLSQCLLGIWNGLADPSILDVYSDMRRKKWAEVTDKVTTDNFMRVTCRYPEETHPVDEWVKGLKYVEGNADVRKQALLQRLGLRYDFTQHYRKPETLEGGSSAANARVTVKA